MKFTFLDIAVDEPTQNAPMLLIVSVSAALALAVLFFFLRHRKNKKR